MTFINCKLYNVVIKRKEVFKILGERIKELRLKKGISIIELGEMTSLSNAYISMLETGKRKSPSIKSIEKIAAALGTTTGYLLNGETNAVIYGEQKQKPLNEKDKLTEYEEQNKIFFSKFGKLSASDRKKVIKIIEMFEEETEQ